MEMLSKAQLECLQRLAHNQGGTGLPCSVSMLEQLERLGLVTRVVEGWLPLENQHTNYALTPAGKSMLNDGALRC